MFPLNGKLIKTLLFLWQLWGLLAEVLSDDDYEKISEFVHKNGFKAEKDEE